jgi:two-component system, LytTR family, sensor kinase
MDENRVSRPAERWWIALWAGVVIGVGLLNSAYRVLRGTITGGSGTIFDVLVGEFTAALNAGILFFAVRLLVRRFPLDRGRFARYLALYVPALATFSAAHTTLNLLLRSAIYAAAGAERYNYGPIRTRYLMELQLDVIVFALMVAGLHAWRHAERLHRSELAAEQLECRLAQARLSSLQLQLQPHFLFNALNTISATMYEDVERADQMIEGLAGLLRTALSTSRSGRVPLSEEIAVLQQYLTIMRARFDDGLVVDLRLDPAALGALVPPLLLQPLVENAIRHGGIETCGAVKIELSASRQGDSLVLEVKDDGPGVEPGIDPFGRGLGLSATAERLALLYGTAHRFEAGDTVPGGFRVWLEIPFATAEPA